MARAYGVAGDQISGPDWIRSQLYSLDAQVPAGTTRDQLKLVLQNPLAERLHVAIHHETKTINAYELVIAKGGPKLKDAAAPDPAKPGSMGGGQFGPEGATLSYPRSPISFLATNLAMRLSVENGEEPSPGAVRVVDKTGLTGTYNITLHYVPSRMTDVPGPDLFSAIEDQVGLKLAPVKMQLDTIVVDHVEKAPAEN